MKKRKNSKRPNLALCLQAGLSVPVAVEACLRERMQGKRLGHWCYKHGLHASTVSAVIRGRRRDRTIRAAIALDLGVAPELIAELLDSLRDG